MRNAGNWRHSRGHVGLRGIDALGAFGGRDAQRVVGGEAPDFLARPLAARASGRASVPATPVPRAASITS